MKFFFNILLVSLFFSCNGQKKQDCVVKLEEKLVPVQDKTLVQGEIINFRDSINCIEWDSLVVVMAAGSKESIEKYTGIKIPYSYSDGSYSLYGDSDAMIFFLKGKIATNHILIKGTCLKGENCRAYDFLDLIEHTNHVFVAKENAVFEVYTRDMKDNQGNEWKRENAIRVKL